MQNSSNPNDRKSNNSKPEKPIKMATPWQVNMIEAILPMMFKTEREIYLEYHVTSLSQLTHKQVREIKAKYVAFMREHPERAIRAYNYR